MADVRCPSCDVVIVLRGRIPTKCEWCKQDLPAATRESLSATQRAQVAAGAIPESSETSNFLARLHGLWQLLLGLVLSVVCVYIPVAAATAGERFVSFWTIGIVAAPLLIVYGILFLIFGKRAWTMIQKPSRKPTRAGWILACIFGGLGVLLLFVVLGVLNRYGYGPSR